jgi:PTH2 family peptidyl-tRNA hydrolase
MADINNKTVIFVSAKQLIPVSERKNSGCVAGGHESVLEGERNRIGNVEATGMTGKISVDSSAFSYKQVIVLRTDINMSKGKMAAVSASEYARKNRPEWWSPWIREGQCKIAVKVKSEQELLELERKAMNAGLPAALIVDRGLTELPPETTTCLGIGPAPSDKMDAITGKLPLL